MHIMQMYTNKWKNFLLAAEVYKASLKKVS